MGIRRGSISTPIIADGLVLNMDAANRASYPAQRTFTIAESGSCYNTLDTTQSGSFIADPQFITQPASASCWSFDGVDDNINCGDFSTYDNGDLTFSVWVYKTESGLDYIIQNSQGSSTKAGFAIVIHSSGNNVFMARNTRTADCSTGYQSMGFTLNNWHNIVGSYTDSNLTLKCYVDGVLKYTKVGSASTNAASEDLVFGRAASDYFWPGNIANVHIYDRAFSASEVLHNYNALKGRFA